MLTKVKVGLIGTGMISNAYIKGCRRFDILDLVACADIDLARAQKVAEEMHIPKACSVEELLADPEIQIVINLTIPKAHAPVCLAAIAAGKHVYVEKPLATSLEDGKRVIEAARAKGVLVGGAAETFLGEAHQTCRRLLDDGVIGTPVAAVAFFGAHWEGEGPNRDFMFQRGGGPMLDMGPYYLSALVNMLGPITRVSGATYTPNPPIHIVERGEFKGRQIPVEVPTHIAGTVNFASGAVGTVITSGEMYGGYDLPRIVVYGTKGQINVPDPNMHVGTVRCYHDGKWDEIKPTHDTAFTRGFGVADMAYAITYQRPYRVNGNLAYHILETMVAFERSSKDSQYIFIESQVERPAPLPVGLPQWELDK